MTLIKPFKAVRPPRDKAYLVASRPFYSYQKSVLKAKLKSNPYTFLHVINPEFGKNDRTMPNSDERFQKVKEIYNDFKHNGYFLKEKSECLYVYKQEIGNDCFIGFIGGAAVDEYHSGQIKIHENTITSREQTFKRYLDICQFNAEPVLLTYPDIPEIEGYLGKVMERRSEYEFTSTDGIKHDLWVIDNPDEIEFIQNNFDEIDDVYIADGHHRSASSVRFADDSNRESCQYFLSYFISESRLKIAEFNRIITNLNNLSETEIINEISKDFIITPSSTSKIKKDCDIKMLLNKNYFDLKIKEGQADMKHPVNGLSVKILSDLILAPIFGIEDEKTDPNIHFVEGVKGKKGLLKQMKKLEANLAFLLPPITIKQLKKVADNNFVMPPKSTWIEPKLRSGLTIYEY